MLLAWFVWSGRIGRLAYFGYSLLLTFIVAVLALLILWPAYGSPNFASVTLVVAIVLGLVATYGGLCLGVKRLHDLDLSGWHYVWMALVPAAVTGAGNATDNLALKIVGGVLTLGVGLYLLFWPGTDGMNRFGYKP